jgi:hypothetical protein
MHLAHSSKVNINTSICFIWYQSHQVKDATVPMGNFLPRDTSNFTFFAVPQGREEAKFPSGQSMDYMAK